jgi:hypothetical protein
MSWFIAAVGLTAVTTLIAADAQNEAGQQKQYDIERQAEQEALGAQSEEITRRARLNKVLAANVNAVASGGISGEGTAQSISLETAKRASSSGGAASVSDRMRQDLLKRNAKSARKAGTTQAASTLLGGALSGAKLYKEGP